MHNTSIGRYVFILALGVCASSTVEARYTPVLFGWGGETIIKVMDFPNTPAFQTVVDFSPAPGRPPEPFIPGQTRRTGKETVYVDVGLIYKTFTVFFLPLWNYDIRWVGYIGMSDNYLEFTKEELDELAADIGMQLPQTPDLPFWDSYGGKLVVLTVILIVGLLVLSGRT